VRLPELKYRSNLGLGCGYSEIKSRIGIFSYKDLESFSRSLADSGSLDAK
jgi:hypothetical protein